MKKILTILIVLSLFSLLPMVHADMTVNQNVTANVSAPPQIIDISINPHMDYGNLIPGVCSAPVQSMIMVNNVTNVNLTVQIQVTDAGADSLFQNIGFDLNNDGNFTTIGSDTLYESIMMPTQGVVIPTMLCVPNNYTSYGEASGTVSYTAMAMDTPFV